MVPNDIKILSEKVFEIFLDTDIYESIDENNVDIILPINIAVYILKTCL
jgi:hypothetical protein